MNKSSILKLSLLISISLLPSCVTPATNPQVTTSPSASANSSDVTTGVVVDTNVTASPNTQPSVIPTPSANAISSSNPTASASALPQVNTSASITLPDNFLSISYPDYYSAPLKWKQITEAKSYRIYQDGQLIADNLNTYNYDVKNLRPNTNYKFDIVAVNDAGESNRSTLNVRTFIPSSSSSNNYNNNNQPYSTPAPIINPRDVSIANVIFVDLNSTGANNGTTWNNAYRNLQDGLNAATSGKQVWVAKGKYYPSAPIMISTSFRTAASTDGRDASFVIKSGVKVYGGFAGTELTVDNRSIGANVTTLSGDINKNDDQILNLHSFNTKSTQLNNFENSFHVVTIVSNDALSPNTGSIDGFTITAGNADGNGSPTDHGGGLLTDKASTTISNIIFTGNNAKYGGAIFNDESTTTINNSTFTGNSSNSPIFGGGGAIYSSNWSGNLMTMNINNSTFTNNIASGGNNGNGGAIYNNRFTVNISGSKFTNNIADNDGGAIFNDTSILNLNTSRFTNNIGTGQWGNGISSDGGSTFNYLTKGNTFTDTTIYPCQQGEGIICAG